MKDYLLIGMIALTTTLVSKVIGLGQYTTLGMCLLTCGLYLFYFYKRERALQLQYELEESNSNIEG